MSKDGAALLHDKRERTTTQAAGRQANWDEIEDFQAGEASMLGEPFRQAG